MKRGSDAVADKEERARFCDSGLRAKEARNTTYKTYWNPRPRRGPGLEPRRGQKRESTQHLPDLEEEVVKTVPAKSGSAFRFWEVRARVLTILSILLWQRT